ncbi:hypothetical protein [Bacillus bingmayongensis]|uniref:hypothetical protein n=1 Tax=Bacillus bingmayongensis TaxID=1150157 RepID=UPI001C8D62D2|nr:hypothetical protein [Bacillus bingmayongensis]MBY0597362.1 hypothetical protein [Bacillus bingmayongensis]
MMNKISNTVIVDFTALPIQNGAYIAGVAIDFFHIDEEENRSYVPYKVASLYIDEKEVDSVSGCIKYALKRLIKEVPEGVKRVVIRSDLKQFMHNRRYREEIDGMIDAEIRIKYFHRLGNKRNQIQLLANDALNRKSSVIGEIE